MEVRQARFFVGNSPSESGFRPVNKPRSIYSSIDMAIRRTKSVRISEFVRKTEINIKSMRGDFHI